MRKSHMKKLLLVTLILLSLNFLPLVKASTITSVNIEIYPKEGDITTDIFVHVRGEPYKGGFVTVAGNVPVLYLYYDDKLIIQRLKCKYYYEGYGDFSSYEALWDVTIKVPNEYPYSELGTHNITAIVEASDGTTATNSTIFKVVNYIPPPEWWTNLPQEFLQLITGPQGLQGVKGDEGDTGARGEKGNFPLLFLAIPLTLSFVSLGIAIFSLTIVVYVYGKLKEKEDLTLNPNP